MIDPDILEKRLKESLERNIILALSEKTGKPLRESLDAYYRSRMASQIDEGKYGIHYLDARYLADDLLENEPSCFGVR
ncbi:MAG: hypothetical protein LBW77_07495 [Verrucomicrobiota bacterium]|jgi:hypothetical protein|nr:hypothetical protein [Verrucomicrobiota bacterium]